VTETHCPSTLVDLNDLVVIMDEKMTFLEHVDVMVVKLCDARIYQETFGGV
jgi:hypothetical protein